MSVSLWFLMDCTDFDRQARKALRKWKKMATNKPIGRQIKGYWIKALNEYLIEYA